MTQVQLTSYLKIKLSQAFSEEWDPRRPTRVDVIEESDSIGLRFFVRGRDGSWLLAHEESLVRLETPADVDALLARALSIFLMKHPGWPR